MILWKSRIPSPRLAIGVDPPQSSCEGYQSDQAKPQGEMDCSSPCRILIPIVEIEDVHTAENGNPQPQSNNPSRPSTIVDGHGATRLGQSTLRRGLWFPLWDLHYPRGARV